MPSSLTADQIQAWTEDRRGPVALHLREALVPVEGKGGVFFPPTYAFKDRVPYNIDTLQDGTKVALVDSVAAQANRMEPVFEEVEELRSLVPQITVAYGDAKKGTEGVTSLLQAGHRLGDALVRSTSMAEDAHAAFEALKRKGDAEPLAKLAPTSLVFGVWDSRDTMEKVPRLLQSTIRAWDVSPLTRSAQFNPALDYAELEVFSESDKEKAEGKSSSPLAERGFVHVPAVGSHGGVVAAGPVQRDLTVNFVQIRRLKGPDDKRTKLLRAYLLGLALVAATEPQDPFLRQGCLLVPDAEAPAVWTLVHRDGTREEVTISADAIQTFAAKAAKAFGVGSDRELTFDKKLAQADTKAGTKKKGKSK